MPASRRARATTFAPRSWPSRPTFPTTTRTGTSPFDARDADIVTSSQAAASRPRCTFTTPHGCDHGCQSTAPRCRRGRPDARRHRCVAAPGGPPSHGVAVVAAPAMGVSLVAFAPGGEALAAVRRLLPLLGLAGRRRVAAGPARLRAVAGRRHVLRLRSALDVRLHLLVLDVDERGVAVDAGAEQVDHQ